MVDTPSYLARNSGTIVKPALISGGKIGSASYYHQFSSIVLLQLISDVFDGDPRQKAILAHFNSKRQRSNAAKTVYATMTQEELKVPFY